MLELGQDCSITCALRGQLACWFQYYTVQSSMYVGLVIFKPEYASDVLRMHTHLKNECNPPFEILHTPSIALATCMQLSCTVIKMRIQDRFDKKKKEIVSLSGKQTKFITTCRLAQSLKCFGALSPTDTADLKLLVDHCVDKGYIF